VKKFLSAITTAALSVCFAAGTAVALPTNGIHARDLAPVVQSVRDDDKWHWWWQRHHRRDRDDDHRHDRDRR
jgi:hypothetical protein